ncbi:GNAT family N-acetyltransferase [Thalassomonas haliotis]|uniref:GNAT family N-acetyltransferase n=1 Tax=Thalassomonas haliotis TaxID=485448 RepID=A0ABY7VGI4_9GAMM|nr:GNAT family N-acetyltransferase [Thalassomonas haliotis]WDE12676.1 GNAT family N-acetyltransferase [Thalassomonas haliotis]
MTKQFIYKNLTPDDFDSIIALGNFVHGDGYLNHENIRTWYEKGIKNGINAGYVVYDQDKLVGFRITFSAGQWHVDKWCSPQLWQVPVDKSCYFKCNTVDENYRGHGIGGQLLKLSIAAAKEQGSLAGVSHLWKQSPGNSAVKYFTKCGGQLVETHPDKWYEDSKNGYNCILCGYDCHCEAAEMIIYFD